MQAKFLSLKTSASQGFFTDNVHYHWRPLKGDELPSIGPETAKKTVRTLDSTLRTLDTHKSAGRKQDKERGPSTSRPASMCTSKQILENLTQRGAQPTPFIALPSSSSSSSPHPSSSSGEFIQGHERSCVTTKRRSALTPRQAQAAQGPPRAP